MGDRTSLLEFSVGGPVADDFGYLLIQVYSIAGTPGHRIVINGWDLGGIDLPPGPVVGNEPVWQTWMDTTERGSLDNGDNTIQKIRDPTEGTDFLVGFAVIHWWERVRLSRAKPDPRGRRA